MIFRVWAPKPERVELDLGGRLVEMARDERGWWSVDVPDAGHNTEYAYRLDGGPPRPDPRSASQPEGVHGASRVVDHSLFPWTDQSWTGAHLPSAVVYELHVGTFSHEGTFDGAIQHLDHLVELGVTAVELLPVAEFPGHRNWGYDGVDLYAPHSAYGGPDGLKRLVDACHHRGLAVILDVVYNHLGPEGCYLGELGPYFTDFFTTPWGDAVNYAREDSDDVRRFAIDNALMWLRDCHVDGLRLDAVHAIIDTSAVHLLEQLATEVEQLSATVGRPLFLIAESDLNDTRLLRSRQAGGYGLDAQWSDDFHHALRTTFTDERRSYYVDFDGLGDLAATLRHGWPHATSYSRFRRRTHGRPYDGLPGWHLLGYAQNHDQVGNRAQGDRLSQLLPVDQLEVVAALVLTAPFVPMLFQGEDWGASTPFQYFTSHTDPELGRAVSEGRRREFAEFGWSPDEVPDPQDPATFERSKLDWSEVGTGDHHRLLEWHRALVALRRSTPELLDGRLDLVHVEVDESARSIVVRRGAITVAAAIGDGPTPVVAGEVVLSSDRVTITRSSPLQ
ncbi:MAG: malto-oligosyltrehalose trehalohydrolase [Actinomycetia bacterium]|nr:malto-oligosyltrehalose trehalohydrolase [Actinomycetes bacterium]